MIARDDSVLSPQSSVLSVVEHGICRLTINRPKKRNALNGEVLRGLRTAIEEAGADPQVRVITVTGAGERVFCAGADLKAVMSPSPTPSQLSSSVRLEGSATAEVPAAGRGMGLGAADAGETEATCGRTVLRSSASEDEPGGGGGFAPGDYRQLLLALHQCPKPTVALARGHVMAGGLGIFLACDLALACDDIQLSTPEIHVGMFPMMVLALLARHVGPKKAAELAFVGESIAASSALAYGMLNRIYPRVEFDDAAEEFVAKVAAKSAAILRLGKEAMQRVADQPLPEALEYLQTALARVMATEDSKEGLRAFLEKRPPRWIDHPDV